MKTALLTLIFNVCAALTMFSQSNVAPRESMLEDDLAMKEYARDPKAEAVVLLDLGDAYFFETFDNNFNIRFTRRTKTRVFTSEGIKYSTISIPFYHTDDDEEEVKDIIAVSYNLSDGKIVRKEIDQSSIYTEKINNRWSARKFVVPDVREGTVFEVRYVIESPFLFNLPDWNFQNNIPTVYSQYTARMIPFFTYSYIIQGTGKLDVQKKEEGNEQRTSRYIPSLPMENKTFRDMVYTFGMRDLPAFRDEAFISSREDYIVKLDMQLSKIYYPNGSTVDIMSTWPELTEDLLKGETLGAYIKKCSGPAQSLLKELTSALPADSLERFRFLTEYVKKSFTWNGYYGKYATENPKDVVKRKTGSSAEINMFLIALLREAGIDADPVILSTRNNGKIKTDYPFESFFNYLIAAVTIAGNIHLADATEPFLAYNRIPPRCMNEKGLLLIKKGPMWVTLPESRISSDFKEIIITPESGKETCGAELLIRASDLIAYQYRTELKDDRKLIEENLRQKGFQTITAISSENYGNPSLDYRINASGTVAVDIVGDQMGINPFLHFPVRENPLKQANRTFPVDMIYPDAKLFKTTINIPDGYKISLIPENFVIDNSLVSIMISYATSDKSLIVSGNYTFKKGVYQPSEYARIKLYFDQIADLFNRQIILEKA